jgi:hypothetical protein
MDHNEAIHLQAAEKYVLGELPPAVRDAYEEHYFDCAQCAIDVKAAAAFVDAGRDILRAERQHAPAVPRAASGAKASSGWFFWLRPAFAVPAFAVLLFIVGYQNLVTIPQAKKGLALGGGELVTSSFSLQMANVRGGNEVKIQIHPDEPFALKFDFTPSKAFDNYLCELQDSSGHSLLRQIVPGSSTNKEAELAVRGGLVKPGKYNLVFTGAPSASGQGSGEEVLRLSFSVEFLR